MRHQAVGTSFLLLVLAGCGHPTIVFDLSDPDPSPSVVAIIEPGDECPGQCLPLAPADWTPYPVLLWIGDEDKSPLHCPPSAPSPFYQGYEHLNVSSVCEECTCSEPVCALPSGLIASDSPMCQGPTFTPWDAPANWDGSCAPVASISADQLGSVTVAPLAAGACKPGAHSVPAKLQPPTWGAYGFACSGVAYGRCKDAGMFCVPAPEPSPAPGFQECIEYTRDDIENASCPDTYPVSHVFYRDYEDTRACTPCGCEPPTSVCSAVVSIYDDDSCSNPIGSTLATLAGSQCVDTEPGKGGKGMSATMVDDEPGQCEPSGGELTGAVTPTFAHVFCCRAQ